MIIFLTDEKKKYINKLIKKILINLLDYEFNIIIYLLCNLIDYIYIRFKFKFNIEEKKNEDIIKKDDVEHNINDNSWDEYDDTCKTILWNKLINEKNKDLISIFYLLLPYIDDKNNFELFKEINKLSDISIKKRNDNEKDLSKNNYKISNIQYNLYINKEINYNIEYVRYNYNLLLNTIDQISNKLYVNWIQIVPLNNYKKSILYQKSVIFKDINNDNENRHYKLFYNLKSDEIVEYYDNYDDHGDINYQNLFKNEGISIGDIYTTLCYHLTMDILNIKWLIYHDIFDNLEIDEMYIKIFNENISIDELYFNINWYELNDNRKKLFQQRWYNILIKTSIKDCYKVYIKKIIIFFETNYKKIKAIVSDYNYIKISKEDFNVNDTDDEDNDEIINFINNIKKIPIEHIYTYFKETIQQFMNTWYGKKIINIKNNEVLFKYETDFKKEYKEIIGKNIKSCKITYKFIYNYAKTLTFIFDKNKFHVRPDWYNSDQTYKKNFLENLNKRYDEMLNDVNLHPINFLKYYEKIYKKRFNKANIDKLSIIIIEDIKKKLIDIVFECHIYNGLYSNLDFSEKKNLNDFKDNYYYLTNNKYKNIPNLHVNNKNLLDSKKKSFLNLIECYIYKWHTFYALDWIAQINFFHKYINNRVILITGSTGTGKSTQIPKLLLYGLKMIDYKLNGNICCSEPRINAVVDNSERISWELGVPIYETSINYKKKIKTYNSNVQFKTKEDNHVVLNNSGLVLNIVTDAILFKELTNNPIFKKSYESNDLNNVDNFDLNAKVYLNENIYDIIIVDEAHEHNTNMDMILTYARDTININNSLRLVIISATMDDDEPIYRVYYKYINDNFKYPYNFLNAELYFNRKYVDRRLHISAPQQTTKYIIKDIYEKNEINNYEEAEKIGIDKVFRILQDSSSGDILFFSITAKTIINICKIINDRLQFKSNIICLPYYRTLDPEWKDFDNIQNKIKDIQIHHSDIIEYIINKKLNYIKVNKNTYNRVIIVCTNIAEASITIDSLKYVIDTGYFLKINYNYITDSIDQEINKISNTSRIQRRGRVGRVSSGIVYYIYKIGTRDLIKSDYNICTEDITDFIYILLHDNSKDENVVSDYIWTKSVYHYLYNIEKYKNFKLIVKNKILKVLIEQHYTYKNVILPSIYNLTNKAMIQKDDNLIKNFIELLDNRNFFSYNTSNLQDILQLYLNHAKNYTGYELENIYDDKGTFYIIHPNENQIKRNILTREIIDEKNELIPIYSEKINSFIYNLIYNNLLIDHDMKINEIKEIFKTRNTTKYSNYKYNFEKSTLGKIIAIVQQDFEFDDNDTKLNKCFMNAIIYSYICDNHYIVIIMIYLITLSNYKIKELVKSIDQFMIKDNNSPELYIYYILSKKIYDIIINKLISIEYSNIKLKIEKEIKLYLEEKNFIIKNIINNKNYWKLNISIELYKKYNLLSNKNKLSYDNIKDNLNESIKNFNITNDMINKIKNIGIIFDDKLIYKLIKKVLIQINNIDEKSNKNNITNTNNIFNWFKLNIPIKINQNEWINIKKAFIYGFNMRYTALYNNLNYRNLLYQNLLISSNLKNNYIVVYISNTANINIVIDTNIETLIELNLNFYNPSIKKFILFNKLPDASIFKFIKEFNYNYKINASKKYKNISHLVYTDKHGTDILEKNNNLIPHIIKMWTSTTNLFLFDYDIRSV